MGEAVVIISFDGYKDIWDTFFKCYFKYWKNCHIKTYLITNNELPSFYDVEIIPTGEEISWSHRVRMALNNIKEDNLLVLLEDYFFYENINDEKIQTFFRVFQEKNYDYLRLMPIPPEYKKKKNNIYPLDPSFIYGVNLQAAIWKKDYLLKLLYDDDFSAWEFEARQKMDSKFRIQGNCMTLNYIGLNYLNGVVQGKWYPRTIRELSKRGIVIPINNRPIIKKRSLIVMDMKNWLLHHIPKNMIKRLKPIFSKFGYKFVTKD